MNYVCVSGWCAPVYKFVLRVLVYYIILKYSSVDFVIYPVDVQYLSYGKFRYMMSCR